MKRFKKMQFADLLGIVALDREGNGYAVDEKSAWKIQSGLTPCAGI